MIIDSIHCSALSIPFNVAFKHASAERSTTQTLWVEARTEGGLLGYGEGCPRDYVTGETLASAQAFVATHNTEWVSRIHDVASLKHWTEAHRAHIDEHPAAWTAVELALLDMLGKEQGCAVDAVLGLPGLAGSFRYTAVLGDAAPQQFAAQLVQYLKAGFSDFKIKLSGERERDLAKVRALTQAGVRAGSVRADANNLWMHSSAAIEHLQSLGFGFFALEEPLHPGDWAGMRRMAEALATKIILDESVLRTSDLGQLAPDAGSWIVNLRVSKMGGLLRSLEVLREARRLGLRIIVGAHVGETSVLTRAALTVANSGRDILVAQEGAFGTHLLAHDVAEPPLMFAARGILDADAWKLNRSAGLGLTVRRPPPA